MKTSSTSFTGWATLDHEGRLIPGMSALFPSFVAATVWAERDKSSGKAQVVEVEVFVRTIGPGREVSAA